MEINKTTIMFKSLFKKTKTEIVSQNEENVQQQNYAQIFLMLITSYLFKNGYDDKCNMGSDVKRDNEHEKEYQSFKEILGYNDLIEDVLINDLEDYFNITTNPNKKEFIKYFTQNFHHIKISKYTSGFIQERNDKIAKAYNSIIECINRIQGWQDNDKLRVKVESNYQNSNSHTSTIYMCTTSFCIVSLGCDQIGSYNIVFSIDYRIKEMIGNDFSNTLIRRIYQFTSGEMESFVNIDSLCFDCVNALDDILNISEKDNSHRVIFNEKFNEF
jgi:hypothetical protein